MLKFRSVPFLNQHIHSPNTCYLPSIIRCRKRHASQKEISDTVLSYENNFGTIRNRLQNFHFKVQYASPNIKRAKRTAIINKDEHMKNGLTLPPIVTRGTTGNSGGFTVNHGFSWGTYATADWQGAGEAIINHDGQTYSLPLSDGPVLSSAEMDMFHSWLEMKSGIKAFTYELQMVNKAVNNDALGGIRDLWRNTESDNYLLNSAAIISHGYFKNKIINFSLADAFAVQQKLSPIEALIKVSATAPYNLNYETMTTELSGGTFSPIKAFAHYLWGNGERDESEH